MFQERGRIAQDTANVWRPWVEVVKTFWDKLPRFTEQVSLALHTPYISLYVFLKPGAVLINATHSNDMLEQLGHTPSVILYVLTFLFRSFDNHDKALKAYASIPVFIVG